MRLALLGARALLLTLAFSGCKKSEPTTDATSGAAVNASAQAAASAAPAAAAGPRADDMQLPTLPPMPIPADNPMSEAKTKLGHALFFDKRLSVDGSRACYSCHLNEDGTGGHDPIAVGAKEKKLTRHSPVLWNVGYLPRLYWDGRSGTLEEQGLAAWAGGNMGVGKENLEKKAKEIAKIPTYKKQFAAVFPDKGVTPETIIQAISAFERTLVCNDTAYDKFAKGDKAALSAQQKLGLELFMGKAACSSCHAPPHFSLAFFGKDGAFFNTGRGTIDKKEKEVDVGRMAVTKSPADWAAFKPPSLRNVHKSPPYFHDGSEFTIEDAVRFMASGGHKNKNLSPLLSDKKLSDEEIKNLVQFLEALSCPNTIPQPT
jgi:cytochrome c peroxidase